MTKNDRSKNANMLVPCPSPKTGEKPQLHVRRIGLVSRNYWHMFGRKLDFSRVLPDVLNVLDEKECDTVLFSLFSISRGFSVMDTLSEMNGLKNITAVLYEEFTPYSKPTKPHQFPGGKPVEQVVCYRRTTADQWHEYRFSQVFYTLSITKHDKAAAKQMDNMSADEYKTELLRCFVNKELPDRLWGNCCVLVCGESNGVKRSTRDGKLKVYDDFGASAAVPKDVTVILNPIHDRMSPKMLIKREFWSTPGRWMISVWNKGKRSKKDGKTRDGNKPAWTVYFNGLPKSIERLESVPEQLCDLKIEIGVVDTRKP
jgi:hypothetical protein